MLRRYQGRAMRSNVPMLAGTHALKSLFSAEAGALPLLPEIRSLGMNLVDQVPALKGMLAQVATGALR